MTELDTTRERTPAVPAWEYADAPESKDIVRLQDRYGLFIGGEFVEPKSGRVHADDRPGDRGGPRRGAEAGPEDVELAVAAARDAFESRWRDAAGHASARSTCTGSRARCRSGRASSRSWSR